MIIILITNACDANFYIFPAYLGRDTHVSRACSVRITGVIRTYHARDTSGFIDAWNARKPLLIFHHLYNGKEERTM